MKTIKEMIVSAVAGVLFVTAVSVLLFASAQREKLIGQVYRQNRFERLLTDVPEENK